MEISPCPFADQWLSLALTSIIVDDQSIVVGFSGLIMTMPNSHISNDDASGSNAPTHSVISLMISMTFIIFPLWALVNQPTVETYCRKDALDALLGCHIIMMSSFPFLTRMEPNAIYD
jgi:hypothetical protein